MKVKEILSWGLVDEGINNTITWKYGSQAPHTHTHTESTRNEEEGDNRGILSLCV